MDKRHMVYSGIVILLAALAAYFVGPYLSVTATGGLYGFSPDTYAADSGDTISIYGTAQIYTPGTYCIAGYTPEYDYVTIKQGSFSNTGKWSFIGSLPVNEFGTYEMYLTDCSNKIYGSAEEFSVSGSSSGSYEDEDDSSDSGSSYTDPCTGVQCQDYCAGYTYYSDGYCSAGACKYTKEYLSENCGYESDDEDDTTDQEENEETEEEDDSGFVWIALGGTGILIGMVAGFRKMKSK